MSLRSTEPAIHRRRLRTELRKARETAGFTQREVATAMDWSHSKIIRIELGDVRISITDLRELLAHYGVTDPRRVDALVATARIARQRSMWHAYSQFGSADFLEYLGYESCATLILGYEAFVVPGLLQVPSYARAVIATSPRPPETAVIDELVELRLLRQEILTGPERPRACFLLDESVIRRVVGGSAVMRDQLKHLRTLLRHRVAEIQIVPHDAGTYPLLRLPSTYLEFGDGAEDSTLYIERFEGDLILHAGETEGRSTISSASYPDLFWAACDLAVQSTEELLAEAINALDEQFPSDPHAA